MTKVIRIEVAARQQQMNINNSPKCRKELNVYTIALGVLSMFCIIAIVAA